MQARWPCWPSCSAWNIACNRAVDIFQAAGAGALAGSLGLGGASVPLPLPGAARWWLPLAPELTPEDRQAIANVTVVRRIPGHGASATTE